MYTDTDYNTKAELKRALAAGQQVTAYQPNADVTGFDSPRNGWVTLEGPHYPRPHRWYAQALLHNGIVVQIK